jgi:hypothetical protein
MGRTARSEVGQVSDYRFWRLAEHPTAGILTAPNAKPSAVKFLTPEQAKKIAQAAKLGAIA